MNPDHFEAALLAYNRRVRASCRRRRVLLWVDVGLVALTVFLIVAFYGCEPVGVHP